VSVNSGPTPTATSSGRTRNSRPPLSTEHLAICVSTSNIHTTLVELDVLNMQTDGCLFKATKRKFRKIRGYKSYFPALFKPVAVEFVQVSFRKLRLESYAYFVISVIYGTTTAAMLQYSSVPMRYHLTRQSSTNSIRDHLDRCLQCRLRSLYTISNIAMKIGNMAYVASSLGFRSASQIA
jgi:hypothetical protein